VNIIIILIILIFDLSLFILQIDDFLLSFINDEIAE
jgi:hypothetical protein